VKNAKVLKICNNGHQFYKSSDCPACPVCEELIKPQEHFLTFIGAPARRTLENNGITDLQKLSKFTESEILNFHGMGPAS
jgi:predicted RecB family nuclease